MIKFKIASRLADIKKKPAWLAEQTDIRPATISKYWYGTVERIDVSHLDKMCKTFNCNVQDLIEYIEDEE